MLEAVARLKGARISPQKARLVVDLVRGQKVEPALNILAFCRRRKPAMMVKKLLESAIANAEQNMGLDPDDLYISKIYVDQGRRLKRLQPRAKGRANQIIKPMSHITVHLAPVHDLEDSE